MQSDSVTLSPQKFGAEVHRQETGFPLPAFAKGQVSVTNLAKGAGEIMIKQALELINQAK